MSNISNNNNINEQLVELPIIDRDDKTIFDKDSFVIPIYQRPFAWTEKEICQLIDDINDFKADHYYIGTLIVNYDESKNSYEVIDGQQRLTALFSLLVYLKHCSFGKDRLTFACREKSNELLNDLVTYSESDLSKYKSDSEYDSVTSLIEGLEIIKDKFKEGEEKIDRETFINKLKKVILYRIQVPPHTDLNRYFEIMNVRGEQLEQHDILKAQLMEPLGTKEQEKFAVIWDCCREMDGYVQMRFPKKLRETFFGDRWNSLKEDELDKYIDKPSELSNNNDYDDDTSNIEQRSILDIINKEKSSETTNVSKNEQDKVQSDSAHFESIIDFPHFLLHVLKVYVKHDLKNSIQVPESTDDKELLKTFENAINDFNKHKETENNTYEENKRQFSLGFIKCLLKCRSLFDKYIIKRYFETDDDEGTWSLKRLYCYGQGSKKSPRFWNSEFSKGKKKNDILHEQNLMIQSCLRVSYVSAKSMSWLTKLLLFLYERFPIEHDNPGLEEFINVTEEIAIEEGKIKEFLSNQDNLELGVNTPHIVLNYLDYLLWNKKDEFKSEGLDFDDFTFKFRNSVEHWYPQTPEDSSKKWEHKDTFGNLCIMQRNINSKFSNLYPLSKKNQYKEQINNGSLKLRLMSSKTIDNDYWTSDDCFKHQEEMINILNEACDKFKNTTDD